MQGTQRCANASANVTQSALYTRCRVCAENEVLRHNMGVYIAEAQQAKRALQSSRRSLRSCTPAAEASVAEVLPTPERPPSLCCAAKDDMVAPAGGQAVSACDHQPRLAAGARSADAGVANARVAGASGLEPQQQAPATADGCSGQEGGIRHEAGLAARAVHAVKPEGCQTQPMQRSGRQAAAGETQPLQAAALQPSPSAQRLTFARSVKYAPFLTAGAG